MQSHIVNQQGQKQTAKRKSIPWLALWGATGFGIVPTIIGAIFLASRGGFSLIGLIIMGTTGGVSLGLVLN